LQEAFIKVSEVIITPRISERKSRGYTADFDEAYHELNARLARDDLSVLQAICDTALKFCRAESTGLSLFGYVDGQPIFNWEVVSGKAAPLAGKIYSPRDNTPCGTVLEMYSYQVFRHPERHYRWARENGFVVPEMITMPIYKEDLQPLGTFWLMHGEGNYFDQEDIRITSMLLTLFNKALRKKAYRKMLTFS
jgi:hypothetical protein